MKHGMVFLMVALLLLGSVSIAAADEAAVPNPLEGATPEEILAQVGVRMVPPENAAMVSYFLIEGESPLAEMIFLLEGVEFSYRAQPAEAMINISGMNYEFETQEIIKIGESEGEIQTYEGEDESVDVALWYDADASRTYSLSMMSDANIDTLVRVAKSLYAAQMEGEAAE